MLSNNVLGGNILCIWGDWAIYRVSTTDLIHLPMQVYSKIATNIRKNKITAKRQFLPELLSPENKQLMKTHSDESQHKQYTFNSESQCNKMQLLVALHGVSQGLISLCHLHV